MRELFKFKDKTCLKLISDVEVERTRMGRCVARFALCAGAKTLKTEIIASLSLIAVAWGLTPFPTDVTVDGGTSFTKLAYARGDRSFLIASLAPVAEEERDSRSETSQKFPLL